jgi:transcription termination/antitermination protein NusA
VVALGRAGVKSLDDLAHLAADELVEMLPSGTMSEADAGAIVMAARAHWFEGEADAGTDGGDGEAAEAEAEEQPVPSEAASGDDSVRQPGSGA